jgi:hypothetical protein
VPFNDHVDGPDKELLDLLVDLLGLPSGTAGVAVADRKPPR